jgi:hypothetical protein
MKTISSPYSTSLRPLVLTWLVLIALSFTSPQLGQDFGGDQGVRLAVAAIIWIKGTLIARYFFEIDHARPFIRRVVHGFVAIVPLTIILTHFFGDAFLRLVTL